MFILSLLSSRVKLPLVRRSEEKAIHICGIRINITAPVTQNNDQNFHMFLCIYKINKKKLTFQIIFKMKG
jgi:hypothetical protein